MESEPESDGSQMGVKQGLNIKVGGNQTRIGRKLKQESDGD